MSCEQNISRQDIIKAFYKKERELRQPIGTILFQTLRPHLADIIKDLDDYELKKYILKKFQTYSQNNGFPPNFSQTKESFGKILDNWTSKYYKNSTKKVQTSIERHNIFALAFILCLDDQVTDEILLSIKQHPLHRGDISETIIRYCLKTPGKKNLNFAYQMYQCFLHLLNSKIDLKTSIKNDISYSKRSEFLKNEMVLTKIASSENNSTVALEESLLERIKAWETLNELSNYFKENDVKVLQKLLFLQEHFSRVSQKTMATICKKEEVNSRSARYFLKNICPTSVSNVFTALNKTLNQDNSIFENCILPTRIYVLLMGLSSWCADNASQLSLKEHVNTLLQNCDFGILNNSCFEDRFVLELNEYTFEKNNVFYCGKMLAKPASSDKKAEIFLEIIKKYFEFSHENDIENPFVSYDWKSSTQFFDFGILETKND